MINRQSLKAILTFNFITVVTIPIALISVITLVILSNNIQNEIAQKNLALSKSLVQEAEDFLNQQQSLLGVVKNFAEDKSSLEDEALNTFLNSIIEHYQFFDMIQIVDKQGYIRQLAPYKGDIFRTNISGYPFFKQTQKLTEPFWSTIFTSPQTGKPTIAVTRIFNKGMIVGYINLYQFGRFFDRFNIGNSGWIEVVDANGTLIYHSDKSLVYQQVNLKNMNLVQQGLSGKTGTFRYREAGREILSNLAVITQTGWPVIVSQTAEEALAPILIARNIFLGGVFGALLLAIWFALYSLGKILQPLSHLAVWAKEVASGQYDISSNHDNYREFNILAEDFLKMTEAIELREQALRESEERYALAVLGAEDGLWDWDIEKNDFYFSPRWKEMLGYSFFEIENHPDEWFNRIHPDDYPNVQKDLNRHFSGETSHFRSEHRLLHKNGSYHWVLARGLVIRNSENVPYRMAGSLSDISERKHDEEKIKASLKEKEILLKEIHHRVKNNMQIISSLLRLQSHYIQDEKQIAMFKDSQNRIRSMSLVHEKLYQSKDLTKIDFSDYIVNLVNSIFRSYTINSERIQLDISVDKIRLGINTAIPCGLIINELVTNSVKYAFPGERSGIIGVTIQQQNKKTIKLIVKDNGIGIPKNIDILHSESLGLQLVTVLIKDQLHGQIDLFRENGTEYQVTFREVK